MLDSFEKRGCLWRRGCVPVLIVLGHDRAHGLTRADESIGIHILSEVVHVRSPLVEEVKPGWRREVRVAGVWRANAER